MIEGYWLKDFFDMLVEIMASIDVVENQIDISDIELVATEYDSRSNTHRVRLRFNNCYYDTPWRSNTDSGALDAMKLVDYISTDQHLLKSKNVLKSINLKTVRLKDGLTMHIIED